MPTDFGTAGTWVDTLLEKAEAAVVAAGLYPADAVFPFLGQPEDLLQNPPRESFLVVTPATMTPDQAAVEGGGNETPRFTGLFTFVQYQRLLSDQQHRDARRLKDGSRGLAQLCRRLLKTLQMWEAAADSVSVLAEPGRLAGPVRFNGRKTPFGWASVETTWELSFLADLS